MSLFNRVLAVVRMRAHRVQEPGDPVQALESLYGRQAGIVVAARQAAVEVAAARRRLEIRNRGLEPGAAERLASDLAVLAAEEQRLHDAAARADNELRRVRAQIDALQAAYAVMAAKARVAEARAGLNADASDARDLVDSAQAQITALAARSSALEQLLESDLIEPPARALDEAERPLDGLVS